jgi:hypothetical protein
MKIRIMSNNLRFRLGRADVETLGNGGRIEEKIRVGAQEMNFTLSASEAANIQVNDRRILVTVPNDRARIWARTDEIGINLKIEGVEIAIEKDFKCLHGPTENEAECFPNPLEQITR